VTRKTRALLVAVPTIVLLVAAAAAAFGFTDDSSAGGTTFVTAANELKAAGCASGFGDGSFGYNTSVTRGQDAIFSAACQSGAAFVNNSTTTATPLTANTPTTLSTLSFTAGLNPGGLQYILVRGQAETGPANTNLLTPTITLTPSAGGTTAQPTSSSCTPTASLAGLRFSFSCEGGFIVPTGQSFTVAFAVTADLAASVFPGTLAANSAPRGNTVSSGRLS
jgi:hypothetical protein